MVMLWLYGINVMVWQNVNLDYTVMFDLEDSRVHLNSTAIFKAAAYLSLTYLTSAAVFTYTSAKHIYHVTAMQPVSGLHVMSLLHVAQELSYLQFSQNPGFNDTYPPLD